MLRAIAVFCLALLLSFPVCAAEPRIFTGFESGRALDGYDLMSYFSGGPLVKGTEEDRVTYEGADWLFSSIENVEAFQASPAAFLPAYGGWCAHKLASGELAGGDPEIWTIYNDRLYIFSDAGARSAWAADRDGYIARADKTYPELVAPPQELEPQPPFEPLPEPEALSDDPTAPPEESPIHTEPTQVVPEIMETPAGAGEGVDEAP